MATDDTNDEHKTAAQLQREIEGQRRRVESTIDQIQDKLSPGQIVDQLMSYGKVNGGEFAANLGKTAMSNPLPVALLGVSLIWLMARPGGSNTAKPSRSNRDDNDYQPSYKRGDYRGTADRASFSASGADYAGNSYDDELYSGSRSYGGVDNTTGSYGAAGSSYGSGSGSSYASGGSNYGAGGGSAGGSGYSGAESTGSDGQRHNNLGQISGSALQRVGQVSDEAGRRYSEFTDDAGKKFRALTDDFGNRAGHFSDESGNFYHGFVDQAGNRVNDFRDEAGSLLAEATGWASHTWQTAQERLQSARGGIGARLHDARDTLGRGVG